jgi:hypothetical protein
LLFSGVFSTFPLDFGCVPLPPPGLAATVGGDLVVGLDDIAACKNGFLLFLRNKSASFNSGI